MARHEQSVADGFNRFLRQAASKRNMQVYDFSLDGQDRDAGADYLLSDSSRYTLIEFKYQIANIREEKDKARRLELCKQLHINPNMADLHDQCHFIAWSTPLSVAKGTGIATNIYRHEVCNCAIFGPSSGLSSAAPHSTSRASGEQFVHDFLTGSGATRALGLVEFEGYLAWLMEMASGSKKANLELLAYDPARSDQCVFVSLNSVSEAHNWMQQHKPAPTNDSEPDSYPSPFRPSW